MEQRVAIVTGASGGIGAATAVEFARRGYAVALAARREDKLREVAHICETATGAAGSAAKTLVVPTDVAKHDQVETLVKRTVDSFGRLDVMVNNAGYGLHALVHQTTDTQMRELFDVNYFGLFYGCQTAAAVMIPQRSGHIFNVSSVIGKRGAPFNGAYSASKFAVIGLTEAMRVEMMQYGVRVTAVCPGLTDTDFFNNVRGGTSMHRSSFASVRGLMPAGRVAQKIVANTGRNRPELVFTIGGKLLVWINHRFPRLADKMMKLYHDDLVRQDAAGKKS